MNIILIGTGRMGRLLKECALDAGDAVVGECASDINDEHAAAREVVDPTRINSH